MREITAGELSKILKEHKNWISTYEEEGKHADLSDATLSNANLSGANLTQVKNLSINKLSKVKTLYKAKLDPELMEQVKDEYPHLLEEPKSVKRNLLKMNKQKLYETYETSDTFLNSFWRGKQPLWKVFWLIGGGLSGVGSLFTYFANAKGFPLITWIIMGIIFVQVQIWWMVSVWRCCKNTNKKIWAILAKIVVLASGINMLVNIVLLFMGK